MGPPSDQATQLPPDPVDLISCKSIMRNPKSKPKEARPRPSLPVPQPVEVHCPRGPFISHLPNTSSDPAPGTVPEGTAFLGDTGGFRGPLKVQTSGVCAMVQGEGLEFLSNVQRQGEVLSQKRVKNHYVRGQQSLQQLC